MVSLFAVCPVLSMFLGVLNLKHLTRPWFPFKGIEKSSPISRFVGLLLMVVLNKDLVKNSGKFQVIRRVYSFLHTLPEWKYSCFFAVYYVYESNRGPR